MKLNSDKNSLLRQREIFWKHFSSNKKSLQWECKSVLIKCLSGKIEKSNISITKSWLKSRNQSARDLRSNKNKKSAIWNSKSGLSNPSLSKERKLFKRKSRNTNKSWKRTKTRELKLIGESLPRLLTKIGSKLKWRKRNFLKRKNKSKGGKGCSILRQVWTVSEDQVREEWLGIVVQEVFNLIIAQGISTLTTRESKYQLAEAKQTSKSKPNQKACVAASKSATKKRDPKPLAELAPNPQSSLPTTKCPLCNNSNNFSSTTTNSLTKTATNILKPLRTNGNSSRCSPCSNTATTSRTTCQNSSSSSSISNKSNSNIRCRVKSTIRHKWMMLYMRAKSSNTTNTAMKKRWWTRWMKKWWIKRSTCDRWRCYSNNNRWWRKKKRRKILKCEIK